MATFYIQLQDKLLQISGELSTESISAALGYTPVSPSVTEELSERVDNTSFDSLKDNPLLSDGSGELDIVDENGNIGLQLSSNGLFVKDVITPDHILSNKADKSEIPSLDEYATKEWVHNENYATETDLKTVIDYNYINNTPLVEDSSGDFNLVDENGNIGFKVSINGVHAKDFLTPTGNLANVLTKISQLETQVANLLKRIEALEGN